ncbi:amino acid/amide ABC transporter substrate-binding protein (HAAT family) [Stella humosa]|uniref:Amino acid/amide ABC transporter substrate-binding protein (HAAT family) n=1 Tax=Stella humosa TaxID=94 RepID=A0A3N1KW81_9PROT|nr:ABC transporter substrate-binding protein [Stella humosa]ROP84204.1 amino acid/amide ABC transporter substrate-binding protein (HAAT family) [Stella humosa]BBK33716.1 ABC transporter substrate-binding protein [Stella humosa]
MKLKQALLASAAGVLFAGAASAQISGDVVKIGVLNDQSSLYADISGQGSVTAARMAVEDFGATVNGKKIEIVFADHQNKPDVGSNIARQWIDRDGVDTIVDVPTSSVALALAPLIKEKNKVFLNSGAASSDLTGKACQTTTVHWTYDTIALSKGTGGAVVKAGGDSWYFLTADYAFGHALERDTAEVVKAAGGKVLGQVRHPLNTSDFSSFLLQAQASKAKVIGLANAGGDTINSIKQAAEFGIVTGGQKLAGLLVFVTDIHALGLQTAQGLQLTEAFYWDQNDETRAFTKRFEAVMKKKPSMVQAGVYGAVLHYLKAIKEVNTDEGEKVVAQMKKMPINDFMTKNGSVREDGRVARDMYLFEVKKPSESKGAWDYYKPIRTIPGDEAYRPLKDGGCSFVKG